MLTILFRRPAKAIVHLIQVHDHPQRPQQVALENFVVRENSDTVQRAVQPINANAMRFDPVAPDEEARIRQLVATLVGTTRKPLYRVVGNCNLTGWVDMDETAVFDNQVADEFPATVQMLYEFVTGAVDSNPLFMVEYLRLLEITRLMPSVAELRRRVDAGEDVTFPVLVRQLLKNPAFGLLLAAFSSGSAELEEQYTMPYFPMNALLSTLLARAEDRVYLFSKKTIEMLENTTNDLEWRDMPFWQSGVTSQLNYIGLEEFQGISMAAILGYGHEIGTATEQRSLYCHQIYLRGGTSVAQISSAIDVPLTTDGTGQVEAALLDGAATEKDLAVFRMMLKCLLYIHSTEFRSEVHGRIDPGAARQKLSKDPRKVARLFSRRARQEAIYRYVLPPAEYERAEAEGRRLDHPVRVKGHWRMQAWGPRHSLRRRTYIWPFWRGLEEGEDAPVSGTVHITKA